MKAYTLVLQAGVPIPWAVGGEFFLLDSAPLGGVTVEFFGAGNVKRDEAIEEGIEGIYARPENGFASLRLTSIQAQTVRFYVARGNLGVNRFSGNLDVTDRAGRLLGTLTGWLGDNRLFSPGFVGGETRTPVNRTEVQLFNPAASGVTVYVDRIFVSGGAGTYSLWRHNAALSNNGALLANKTIGGAAPAAQVRWGDAVGTTGSNFGFLRTNASEQIIVPFEEPIILPAGFGVHVRREVGAGVADVTYEWREG